MSMLAAEILKWEDIEKAFRKVFEKKSYTNHGFLAQNLEKQLEAMLSAKHVIVVTNYTIALALADKAKGEDETLRVLSLYPSMCMVPCACVCTDSDSLAVKLRNMRSSYGAGKKVDVPLTANGRVSEAQAAMALMGLACIRTASKEG